MEVNRGCYSAEFGDRTYGVFNIVPPTGFERNNEAEVVLSAGNFYQTSDRINFGNHTERFAYYASVNGNRRNLGIQTPVPQTVHEAANRYSGFGSLVFNLDPSNQLRLVTSLRKDYYQIPYDPFPDDIKNGAIPGFTLAPNPVPSTLPTTMKGVRATTITAIASNFFAMVLHRARSRAVLTFFDSPEKRAMVRLSASMKSVLTSR